MPKLLTINDLPDIWFQRLLGACLEEIEGVEPSDFKIMQATEFNQFDDKHVITIQSETTDNHQFVNAGIDSNHITQYLIFTLRIYSMNNTPLGINSSDQFGQQLSYTLLNMLGESNAKDFHLYNIIQTSTPKRFGKDLNNNPIWDVRFSMLFHKQKEDIL